jgi:broad specificity phosphatase PhoE
MTETRIDFIRHGLPEGGNRIRGNGVDDPLSTEGWAQMRRTAAAIRGWQRLVSSPMRRCVAFAEWLAEQRGLPMTVESRVREVGFGDWEGVDRKTLETERSSEYTAFHRNPAENRPAGAEPLADFGRRVADTFDALLQAHPGEHLLVVAHAGVIRATLGHVLEAPLSSWYRIEVAHAALTRFTLDAQAVRVVFHNWRPDDAG